MGRLAAGVFSSLFSFLNCLARANSSWRLSSIYTNASHRVKTAHAGKTQDQQQRTKRRMWTFSLSLFMSAVCKHDRQIFVHHLTTLFADALESTTEAWSPLTSPLISSSSSSEPASQVSMTKCTSRPATFGHNRQMLDGWTCLKGQPGASG